MLLIVEIMANYIVKMFGFLTKQQQKKKGNLVIVGIGLML